MFQPIDNLRKETRGLLYWLIALGASLMFLPGFTSAAPLGIDDGTAEALLAELGERYEVVPLSRGYVLQPTSPDVAEDQIEIDERGVVIDGQAQELDQLRTLFGDEANIFFALAGEASALAGLEEMQERIAERVATRAREVEDSLQREAEEFERQSSRLDEDPAGEQGEDQAEEPVKRRTERESGKKVRMDTRFSLGSSLTVEKTQSVREAVVVLGPLIMDGEVRGDTVVVLGSAEINGHIEGDLTVVGGNLLLGPDAVIDGDLTCIGKLDDAEGVVHGEIQEIPAPYLNGISWFERGGRDASRQGLRWLEFAGSLFSTLFLAMVVGIAAVAARRRVGAVAHRAHQEPWKSGLVGAMVQVLTLPAVMLISLILIVSIVGIPVLMVLLPLTILVLALVSILGYAGVAAVVGRAVLGLGRKPPYQWASLLTVMLGLVLIQGWQIVGEGITLTGGGIRFLGFFLLAIGFFVKYLVWTVGLGAVMLDRFSPLPAVAASGSSLGGGSHSFTSPFASPRSPGSPIPPIPPVPPVPPASPGTPASPVAPASPPLPWEVEDDPNADHEYRQAGEPAMSAAKKSKASPPELSDEEYQDVGRTSKPPGSST